MKINFRIILALAMLAPALLLICSCLAGCGGHSDSSRSSAILFPPDDPGNLPQPAKDGTRGPAALLFDPDGKKLYVAEQDENDIAIIDPNTGKPIGHIPSGGTQPTAISLSPDGHTLLAANTFSGSLGILDLEKGAIRSTISMLGEPCGVVLTSSGKAFVSLSQLDQVAVVDVEAGKVLSRIPVGHHPRSLLLSSDGNTLYCANRVGGSLSIIDVDAGKERARITMPVTNLRGLALSPDGSRLYVTAQQAHNDLTTEKPEAIWSNVLCAVHLDKGTGTVENTTILDLPNRGAADPCGVVIDESGDIAYVTLSGTHEVIRVPLNQKSKPAGNSTPLQRVHTGANPRAIALRPGSSELWIGNHLGSTLSVLSSAKSNSSGAQTGVLRQVSLGAPTPSPNRHLKGRYFFTSAHIVRGQHFSCDSCHPDGNTDGLSWKLAHVKELPEIRNTRDLRGNLLLTAPYGWTSRQEDFEVFVEDEVSGLLKTRLLQHPEVHALWDLVNESPLPPNPFRTPEGLLTEAGKRGEKLFEGEAACVSCHLGDMRGGTKKREWVGTTIPGLKLDVPHLVGTYESAPYLHDGRAATLEEVFTKYNPNHTHGSAHLLTPTQFTDLIEYVREQ